MPWNAHTATPVNHADAVDLKPDFNLHQNPDGAVKPMNKQVKAAQSAVGELLKAFDKKGLVRVEMHGHANPADETPEQSGPDSITITVTDVPSP